MKTGLRRDTEVGATKTMGTTAEIINHSGLIFVYQ